MLKYIVKRLGYAIVVLLGVSLIIYFLTRLMPIDFVRDKVVAMQTSGAEVTAEQVEKMILAGDKMRAKFGVPCTACRYCTDGCPVSLDIPELIKAYNRRDYEGLYGVKRMDEDKKPTACIACRACERACPQGIKISEVFSDFSDRIE